MQTVDFFTPVVDDPYAYGQIAAANALSDVYAMGGRPLTALNVAAFPMDDLPPKVIARILKGGGAKVREAGCSLVGGHTVRNPEPLYGLSVTGIVSPRRMITNANARPGDALILTKPLGTGIVATAIKRDKAPRALAARAVRGMKQLNTIGALVAEAGLVRAGTDVTGFGLLGHLIHICRSSKVAAVIHSDHVPAIGPGVFDLIAGGCVPGGSRDNLESAARYTTFQDVAEERKILLADAQTSGGLLLCVPRRHVDAVLRILEENNAACAVPIGEILASRHPRIRVS